MRTGVSGLSPMYTRRPGGKPAFEVRVGRRRCLWDFMQRGLFHLLVIHVLPFAVVSAGDLLLVVRFDGDVAAIVLQPATAEDGGKQKINGGCNQQNIDE